MRLSLLVLAALLPVLLLFIYTAHAQRAAAEREVTDDVHNFARIAAEQQSRLLESTRQLLLTIARLPEVRGPHPKGCDALLTDLLSAYPVYGNLGVADARGKVICAARPHEGMSVADRSYFQRAMQTADFAMGEFLIGRMTGRAQVNFAFPLIDAKGSPSGVVFAAVDLDWVNRLAAQVPLPQGSAMLLIDRSGTVLVRSPGPSRFVGTSVAGTEFFRHLANQGDEVLEYPGLDGQKRLFASQALRDPAGSAGYLVVGVPRSIAWSDADRLLARNLRALALVAVATLVVLWVGGYWFFLRRVHTLLGATERISSGDLTARSGLAGGDELGLLSRAFDEMAAHTEEAVEKKDASLVLLDTLLLSAPVALAYLDRRLRFVKVNRLLSELDQVSPEQHVGRKFEDVLPRSELLERAIARVFATGEPVTGLELSEGPFAGPRGGRIYSASVHPVRGEPGGALSGVGLAIHDITASKYAEQTQRFFADASRVLSESLRDEVTFQAIARLAVPVLGDWCIVDVLNPDGTLDQAAVAFADPADAKIADRLELGYPLSVSADYGPGVVVRTGRSRRTDLSSEARAAGMLAPDDPLRDARLALFRELGLHSYLSVPMVVHGRTFGAITLLLTRTRRSFDSRDQQRAEELGRRAALAIENVQLYAAAQQAIRLREQFISVASHELRTPLTPLKLQLQTLQRRLEQPNLGGDVKPLVEKFQLAIRQTDRLSKLVNDLLDVSRISVGKLHLEREEADLGEIASEVVERFREEASRAGCQLTLERPASAPGQWDPGRIEQVVVNLLTNAIKYGAGKPIEVKVEPADATGEVTLTVRDHGIGIAPADRARIFERFERAVSERAYGGLGLGLFIARELVAAHGGTISVSSEEGEGSTFVVALPQRSIGDARGLEGEVGAALPPPG